NTPALSMKIKVLHIIVGLERAGAELMLQRLIQHTHSTHDEIEHSVISLTTLGPIGEELQSEGIKVLPLNMQLKRCIPRALVKIFSHIRAYKPDIVQTWMYHSDLLGGIVAR